MEARSSTVLSALIARETERRDHRMGHHLSIHQSPDPGRDGRARDAGARTRPLLVGLRCQPIFMKEIGADDVKPLNPDPRRCADRPRSPGGRGLQLRGQDVHRGRAGAVVAKRESPRGSVPIYVAGTGPRMQRYAGEEGDGLLTASITTPGVHPLLHAEHARGRRGQRSRRRRSRPRLHDRRRRSTRTATRAAEGAREIAGMYLANKVQNIQGSADVLLEDAGPHPGGDPPDRRGDGVGRTAAPRRRRSPTRSSTSASRSRARRRLHRSDRGVRAMPAAPTSCSSSGATTVSARSSCSPRRSSPTSSDDCGRRSELSERLIGCIDEQRLVGTACTYVDTPSPTGSEQAMGEQGPRGVRGRRAAGELAAGRGWPSERDRHARGPGRRADADVQRPHGHVLLRARAAPAPHLRLPARGAWSRTGASTASASAT